MALTLATVREWASQHAKDYSLRRYIVGTTEKFAILTNDAAMGEVVTSPAANTLLARLKAIVTQLAAGVAANGWAWTSVFGVSGAVVTSADVSTAAAVTDVPTTGQKIVLDSVVISSAAAITVDLQEETSAAIIAKFYMPVNSTVTWKPEGKVKLATINKKLMVHASGAGAVSVTAVYHSEA